MLDADHKPSERLDGPTEPSALARLILEIEGLLPEGRLMKYREFAALELVKYLTAKELVVPPPKMEELQLVEKLCGEGEDGLTFGYLIRGSHWEINLHRDENCRKEIEEHPELLDAPSEHSRLYVMDLHKPAKVQNLDFGMLQAQTGISNLPN